MKLPTVLALTVALAATGCASLDGQSHTPITGSSIHKAYRLAERDGWVRVEQAGGPRVWVRYASLAPLNAKVLMASTVQQRLDAEAARVALVDAIGKTDAQMQAAYNPGGIAWAKVGDGALLTALAGAATWGISEIVKSVDSGDGGKDSASNGGMVENDRHDVGSTINVSTRDGSPVTITLVNGQSTGAPME